MRFFRTTFWLSWVGLVALGPGPAWAHEEQVILVGRSAAGELKVDSDFAQPVELAVSVFPGISGHAAGEVAFHSSALDDPGEDFFQLSPAASFRFILLEKDPGMEVWNDTGTGYLATNQTYFLGGSPFDNHPIWNIANGTPGTAYSVTLKLQDVNGVYPDSAPFVLLFTPVRVVPRVKLEQAGPLHATLSWPTNASGWELQTAVSLTSTNWATVTNVPSIAGTNFFLNIATDGQGFFRLKQL